MEGVVLSVADGDTLTLRTRDGRKVKVRLYGIDAPEVPHKETPGQPHGAEARGALSARVRGREVAVEIVDEDDYGRSVGVVRDGPDDVNLAMVRAGHAWAYRKHLRPPYEAPYREAQRRARAERLGLWREPGAVPPWAFKSRLRATAVP